MGNTTQQNLCALVCVTVCDNVKMRARPTRMSEADLDGQTGSDEPEPAAYSGWGDNVPTMLASSASGRSAM